MGISEEATCSPANREAEGAGVSVDFSLGFIAGWMLSNALCSAAALFYILHKLEDRKHG